MNKVKRNNYKFWHSPIALIVLFLTFIVFGYKIIDLTEKNKETSNKKELILEQIDELQKKEQALSSSISKLETDEGKEEIIREKYQVAKKGEKMLTIVEDRDTNSSLDEEKVSHGFINWLKNIFNK